MVLAAAAPAQSALFAKGGVRAWDVDGNRVELESRSLDVTSLFPSGTTRTATFEALYDHGSGLFWSMYTLTTGDQGPAFVSAFAKCAATVVLPDQIINFQADATPMIFIRSSNLHAHTLDEGLDRAVTAYSKQLNTVERAYPQTQAARIDLSTVFEADYYQNQGPLHAHDALLVSQVQLTDGTWRVILSGDTHRQGAATIDSGDYRLVATEKLS
jgi:hypothetical protein